MAYTDCFTDYCVEYDDSGLQRLYLRTPGVTPHRPLGRHDGGRARRDAGGDPESGYDARPYRPA